MNEKISVYFNNILIFFMLLSIIACDPNRHYSNLAVSEFSEVEILRKVCLKPEQPIRIFGARLVDQSTYIFINKNPCSRASSFKLLENEANVESEDTPVENTRGTIYFASNNVEPETFGGDSDAINRLQNEGRRVVDVSGLTPDKFGEVIAEDVKENPGWTSNSVLILSGHGIAGKPDFSDQYQVKGRLKPEDFAHHINLGKDSQSTKLDYPTLDYVKQYQKSIGEQNLGCVILDTCFAGHALKDSEITSKNVPIAIGSSEGMQQSFTTNISKTNTKDNTGKVISDLVALNLDPDSEVYRGVGKLSENGQPNIKGYLEYRKTNPFAELGTGYFEIGSDLKEMQTIDTQNISFASENNVDAVKLQRISNFLFSPPANLEYPSTKGVSDFLAENPNRPVRKSSRNPIRPDPSR